MSNRRLPTVEDRMRILIRQRGLCLYCELPLDGYVFRGGKVTWLELQWDHFVPFAYLGRNPDDNWVASCQVCNRIKSNFVFASVHEAQEFIQRRRNQLGYTLDRPRGLQPHEWDEENEPAAKVDVSEPAKHPYPKNSRAMGRSCPGCGKQKPDLGYCDDCRCTGTASNGRRCRVRAKVDGRCEYHP